MEEPTLNSHNKLEYEPAHNCDARKGTSCDRTHAALMEKSQIPRKSRISATAVSVNMSEILFC